MADSEPRFVLGTVEAAEAVLTDLYTSLRSSLRRWSEVTKQTPQARMGYVGQHLTSVVTGFQGSRSGARGKDLLLPDGEYAEIKTCYRVDQLGKCLDCGAGVASIEVQCPSCGNEHIQRNDDSKWLISVRSEEEMRELFKPRSYYLVLFDFADLAAAADIKARIYEVNPREKGFAYCMVDYYVNIWPSSTAPFDFWPFSLKFDIMKPTLIYSSLIKSDDSIETRIFAGKLGTPEPIGPRPLDAYSRSRNLTVECLGSLARDLGIKLPSAGTKKIMLAALQELREKNDWKDDYLADALAECLYAERIKDHRKWLPENLA